MANKKVNLEMTPLMTLSAMAIFAMMPILISMVNNQDRIRTSEAAEPVVVVSTPTPTSSPELMYER